MRISKRIMWIISKSHRDFFFFFDIFAIHSSSRHEKRCQMSLRLFSLFRGSIYQQWVVIFQRLTWSLVRPYGLIKNIAPSLSIPSPHLKYWLTRPLMPCHIYFTIIAKTAVYIVFVLLLVLLKYLTWYIIGSYRWLISKVFHFGSNCQKKPKSLSLCKL